jgi:hypothetical protein
LYCAAQAAVRTVFSLLPALKSDPSCFGQAARYSVKGAQGHLLAA